MITRRLAARYGATAPRPRVERAPVRSLEDIAVENAVEGCVRETFGALVGAWQARLKWAGLPNERAQKELAQRLRDAMQA